MSGRRRLAAFRRQHRDGARRIPQPRPERSRSGRIRLASIVTIGAVIIAAGAIVTAAGLGGRSAAENSVASDPTRSAVLPHKPAAYLGVYAPPSPASYAGVTAFSKATGAKLGLVLYYSGWNEAFQVKFAAAARKHHAVPLVQIDPTGFRLKAIAAGRYDAYLRSYASAVKAFGTQVVIGFGHEMNGNWYGWGYRHASPAAFVAAWRHIVNVFRQRGAGNVTWLWTINVINRRGGSCNPGPWWPGSSYVNWVGIDGYYDRPSWTFASLFGPTIKAVRKLTLDPILVSETAAPGRAAQPAKIANLFAGIRAYGLLGFVWFDANRMHDWRLRSPAAIAAFRKGAQTFREPPP
jgi:mannan endo-1,4-beta-mannosidase